MVYISLILGLLYSTHLMAQLPARIIVSYKNQNKTSVLGLSAMRDRASSPSQRLGPDEEMEEVLEQLRQHPDVAWAEPDIPMSVMSFSMPEDQYFDVQWNLKEEVGGANFVRAWEETQGSSNTVIAVLDTGILPHPDLTAKLLPGFDMISEPEISNDGSTGRDNDPTDPGDWVGPGDFCYEGWSKNSTWHGTHVAGIAAASTHNGIGIAGADWNARVLPVRVLGKCGGYSSDIADGIRWAAGAPVEGIPLNPHPAKVINLSLGGSGACGQYMQQAIDEAIKRGSLVVVAAGNSNYNLDWTNVTPANCEGVLTVGASNQIGDRAGYSNYGEQIDLLAPGGDYHGPILSTHNQGQKGPLSFNYHGLNGTSMAAPHVSAAASLIFSLNPSLYPLQVKDILKRTTKAFGDTSLCDNSFCGEGLLDAFEAVLMARNEKPDRNYAHISPVTSDEEEVNSRLEISESRGGGCGTIDLGDGGGANGGGPLILTFLAALLGLQLMKRPGLLN